MTESKTTPAIEKAAEALAVERRNAINYILTCVQSQKINGATLASLLDRICNASIALHTEKAFARSTRGAELTPDELKALRAKGEDL
jgi:uncharacterized protein involved in exopolysaccharide biosynthesis